MELDLINYQKKYKTDKISDNACFMKISQKFVIKGYANISRKSIKYKYEKLQATGRIKELEEEALMNLVESDDEDSEFKKIEKKCHTRKKIRFVEWNQEMEILLINLVNRLRHDSPAMSDNSIFRKVTFHLQKEGSTNLTEHIVLYHYRKLKQNVEKFQRLMELSNKLVLNMFHCEDERESTDYHANDYQKRNYLYWTEEMKEALLRYHKILKKQPGITEFWENVAKMMREDGFGDFTSDNVKYKYFNLKRKKESVVMIEDFEPAEA